MVNRPRSVTLAACLSAALGFAQTGTITPNSMLDGTRAAQAEAPKPVLSAESRGDIFMARKMYREAIEAFSEGSPKDPVLRNKIGIAYHQHDAARYRQEILRAGSQAETQLLRSHQQSGHGVLRDQELSPGHLAIQESHQARARLGIHPQQPRHRLLRAQPDRAGHRGIPHRAQARSRTSSSTTAATA